MDRARVPAFSRRTGGEAPGPNVSVSSSWSHHPPLWGTISPMYVIYIYIYIYIYIIYIYIYIDR